VKLGLALRRFLVPAPVVTLVYLLRFRCKVSLRAEVELSPGIRVGRGSEIASFAKLKASGGGELRIGERVSIGTGCFISADRGGVSIGDWCMVGPNACIIGNNYRYDRLDVPIAQQEKTSKGIRIGDNVWIGAGAVVTDGARIESGAIVAPNSVVAGKVPKDAIVQGNPARVVFTRR
jgi:acetyltransferase-like isoleucine patch superfamily enzyme